MASILASPLSKRNLSSRRPSLNRRAVLLPVVGIKFHLNGFPVPSFSYRNTRGLELLRQRSFSVTASNSSDGNSIKEESDSSKVSSDAQGPPFLTIFAGFFVLSLVLWLTGSAVTSLVGLVVKLISTK